MVAAQKNAYAPAIRFDADDRNDEAIIDARNIAVTFKVEHGTVEAVKDISFQLYRGRRLPSSANPVRGNRSRPERSWGY